MIVDKFLELCDATSVAATAGTALVGSQIDLQSTGIDLGTGEPLWLVIRATTEIITGGSAGTIVFKLASDSTASIAVDGSATEHIISPTYVTDDSAANSDALNAGGNIIVAPLPTGSYERYLGLLVVTAVTTTTAGAVDAFITTNPPKWRAYPDAL